MNQEKLSTLSEEQITNDRETVEEYVRKYTPLVYHIVHKYFTKNPHYRKIGKVAKCEFDDLRQIGLLALFCAAKNYRSDGGASPITYFYKSIRGRLFRHVSRESKRQKHIFASGDMCMFSEKNNWARGIKSQEAMEQLIVQLEAIPNGMRLLDRIREGRSQVEEAKARHCTKQNISLMEARVKRILEKNRTDRDLIYGGVK